MVHINDSFEKLTRENSRGCDTDFCDKKQLWVGVSGQDKLHFKYQKKKRGCVPKKGFLQAVLEEDSECLPDGFKTLRCQQMMEKESDHIVSQPGH